MIAVGRTPSVVQTTHRLQLIGTLALGIGVGWVAQGGVTDQRLAEAQSRHPSAQVGIEPPVDALEMPSRTSLTTSASEQYRAAYTHSGAPIATSTASEEYRAAYTGQD